MCLQERHTLIHQFYEPVVYKCFMFLALVESTFIDDGDSHVVGRGLQMGGVSRNDVAVNAE